MLFKDITAFHTEYHIKPINPSAALMIINVAGSYTYHLALKGHHLRIQEFGRHLSTLKELTTGYMT
jgi:hypothetical protein